jgi:hypothetical protein
MEEAVSVPMSTTSKLSVYDGRQPIAVIEQHDDGWHVTVRNRHIGVAADRAAALRLVNATVTTGNLKGSSS